MATAPFSRRAGGWPPGSGLRFLQVLQRRPDGGNHKGREGAVCPTNGMLDFCNYIIGKSNAFIGRGRVFRNFKV